MKNKRFLIKLSGEFLKGESPSNLSWEFIDFFSKKVAGRTAKGYCFGFVIGGGNIFRGASGNIKGYDRLLGDNIGMMSTVINGLALAERLRANGVKTLIQSGIRIDGVAGLFNADDVENAFRNKQAVIFCGGLGNPYFSTDTTSVVRALQIKAEYVFKMTKVDGIYDRDPALFNDAKKFDRITFDEIISLNLGIMDLTSILLMKKNRLKLMVFNMNDLSNLEKACAGKKVGTIAGE